LHISKITNHYHINKAQRYTKQAKEVAYRIQQYNNFVIDDYVESVDDSNPKKPSPAMLWADLSVLMKPAVYQNYQKIINSKYTSDKAFDKMLVRTKAEKDLNRIVEEQVNRIGKNVDYVEKVLNQVTMPLNDYHRMLDEQKNRSVANRMKIMEDVAKQREEIMQSEGFNIPSEYSYRDLDVLSENLMRQSQSASDWEEAVAMNNEAEANGEPLPFTQKRWIHTHDGATTRHQEMGNYPPIPFEDYFQVEDENSGVVDQMLYPRDTNGSIENVAGCVCDIEYF
jgi:hypothetical protein